MKLLIMVFVSASCYFLSSRLKYITRSLLTKSLPHICFFFIMKDQLSHSYNVTDNVLFLCSFMHLILNSVMLRRNIVDLLVAGVLSKTSCM
jgi:hypothetical protein